MPDDRACRVRRARDHTVFGVLHFLPMKPVTGRVENGKVALPEGEFEEGAAVAVLSTTDEPVGLTSAEEEALLESLSAVRSGSYISSEDLLRQLRLRCR